jgi:hypothetical protein
MTAGPGGLGSPTAARFATSHKISYVALGGAQALRRAAMFDRLRLSLGELTLEIVRIPQA